MIGSLIMLFTIIAGIISGYFGLMPDFILENDPGMIILYILLFTVGLSLGNDKDLFDKIKSQSPYLLLVPLITIVSSLLGVLLFAPLVSGRTVSECMAVGSGFAYYSLSSVIISEYKGADLGVVALMANLMREVFVLLAAPLLVKYFGKLSPICCGGATTMDSTLPVITKNCGNEFAIIALINGIAVDFCVPFLVTYFCTT